MTVSLVFFFFCLINFVYFGKRVNYVGPFTLISILWLISALFGVVVVHYDLIENIRGKITVVPYLFLFMCVCVCFYPFYKMKFDTIKVVSTCNYERILFYLSVFFIVLSILPLLEHALLLFKSSGSSVNFQQQIADTYEMKRESDVSQLSFPGRMMNGFLSNFRCIVIILFFYYLGNSKVSRKFKFLLFCPIVNQVLDHFLAASRASLFFDMANMFFVFLVLQNSYSKKLKEKIQKVLLLVSSVITSFLIVVSLARYLFSSKISSGASTLFDWFAIYLGEATVRFNAHMWDVSAYTMGDSCFSFVKSLLGLPTFTDLLERRAYWYPKTKIPTHVFYTFIGDFYGDFGPVGCVCIVLCMILPFYFIFNSMKKNKSVIKFHHLIYVCLWGSICLYGFTYFLYKTYFGFRTFFVQLLFMVFLSFLSHSHFLRRRSKI